jgi:hypothetical protein
MGQVMKIESCEIVVARSLLPQGFNALRIKTCIQICFVRAEPRGEAKESCAEQTPKKNCNQQFDREFR